MQLSSFVQIMKSTVHGPAGSALKMYSQKTSEEVIRSGGASHHQANSIGRHDTERRETLRTRLLRRRSGPGGLLLLLACFDSNNNNLHCGDMHRDKLLI